jgi:hypothetical protein
MDLSSAAWRKSSYSAGNGGDCVEVARDLPGIVAVRDSKDHHGVVLTVTRSGWAEFVAGIKSGELDLH